MEDEKSIELLRTRFFLKQIGHRIVELRKIQNISQEELAYRVKCTTKTLSDIETGKSNMYIATLRKIAKALDVSLSVFFECFDE